MSNVKIFKALADETRLSIVQHLATKSEPVASKDVVSSCSTALALSQPTLSHHLSILEDAQVVIVYKQGREKFYALNTDHLLNAGIASDRI